MNSSSTQGTILSEHVYLNFLSAEQGEQYEISRNVILLTAGAFTWDVAVGCGKDAQLVGLGLRLSLIPYFLAKAGALSFAILSVIINTVPIPNCKSFEYGIMLCSILASVCYSTLLILRIRDRYRESFLVRGGFMVFLSVLVAFSVISPLGRDFAHIPGTHHCIPRRLQGMAVVAVYLGLAFVFCVFAATSYHITRTEEKLQKESTSPTLGPGEGGYGGSNGLYSANIRPVGPRDAINTTSTINPSETRSRKEIIQSLIKGGQHYYLVMVLINFVTASFVFTSLPVILQTMIMVPNAALSTSMACRAYRDVAMNIVSASDRKSVATSSDTRLEEGRSEGRIGSGQEWDTRSIETVPRLRREPRSLQSLKLMEHEKRYSLLQVKPIQRSERGCSSDGHESVYRSGRSRQLDSRGSGTHCTVLQNGS